jgi:hypothetical protein
MVPLPDTAQERVALARKREKRDRDRAGNKRARGEDFLARLYERSADAQAAVAIAAGRLIVSDPVGQGRPAAPPIL